MNLMTPSFDPSSCVFPAHICLLFQTSKPTVENDFESQKHRECFPHLQDLAKDIQENIDPTVRSPCDNQLLSEDSNAKQSGKIVAFYCYCPGYPFFFFLFLSL